MKVQFEKATCGADCENLNCQKEHEDLWVVYTDSMTRKLGSYRSKHAAENHARSEQRIEAARKQRHQELKLKVR